MIGLVAAAVIIVPQVLNTARTSDMRNNVTNQPTTATQQANGSATIERRRPARTTLRSCRTTSRAPRFRGKRPPSGSVW